MLRLRCRGEGEDDITVVVSVAREEGEEKDWRRCCHCYN